MAHNIEIRKINGVEVASFAENGKRERAWHGLGNDQQIFDRPMYVEEALKACNANYEVKLTPVVALSDQLVHAMENGEFINASILKTSTKALGWLVRNMELCLINRPLSLLTCSVVENLLKEIMLQ